MKRMIIAVFLAGVGGLLVVIGGFAMIFTDAFFGANGIVIPSDASLRSEIRAPTGLLLLCGLIIAASGFRRSIAALGLGLTALVYGAYGLSRVVSMAFDGVPADGLVGAMIIELIVGALALAALRYVRP